MRALRNLIRDLDAYEDMKEIAEGFREVVFQQRDIIAERNERIRMMELEHARHLRALLANFILAIDQPDQEHLRSAIVRAFEDMADQVARLEEHV